jgi:hypothetical protein
MADGGFSTDAVAVIDTSRRIGRRVLVEASGAMIEIGLFEHACGTAPPGAGGR